MPAPRPDRHPGRDILADRAGGHQDYDRVGAAGDVDDRPRLPGRDGGKPSVPGTTYTVAAPYSPGSRRRRHRRRHTGRPGRSRRRAAVSSSSEDLQMPRGCSQRGRGLPTLLLRVGTRATGEARAQSRVRRSRGWRGTRRAGRRLRALVGNDGSGRAGRGRRTRGDLTAAAARPTTTRRRTPRSRQRVRGHRLLLARHDGLERGIARLGVGVGDRTIAGSAVETSRTAPSLSRLMLTVPPSTESAPAKVAWLMPSPVRPPSRTTDISASVEPACR